MNKQKIKDLYEKYKDLIPYAIFGVFTTIVNIVAYWVCARVFDMGVVPSTIVAWVLAVFFAYVTNRKWVFHSENMGAKAIIKECVSFFAYRLATGLLDLGCMYVFADLMGLNDIVIKTLSNIVVIILNYLASKFLVFKKSLTSK